MGYPGSDRPPSIFLTGAIALLVAVLYSYAARVKLARVIGSQDHGCTQGWSLSRQLRKRHYPVRKYEPSPIFS